MKHIKIMIMSFIDEMLKRNLGAYAGSTAFFFLLSLIPILILSSTLIPLIGISQESFVQFFSTLSPDVIDQYLEIIMKDAFNMSSAVLPLTVIILIWSCARGMLGLMYGLNQVYDVDHDQGYFYLRLLATFYTLLLTLLLISMVVLLVFGRSAVQAMYLTHPDLGFLFNMIYNMRYFVVSVSGVLILTLMYKLVPRENQPLLEQVPGAIFTVFGWILFTKLFSFFATQKIYETYYGRFSVLAIAMVWLYWCIYIILIGGYINWYFRYVFRTLIGHFKRKKEAKRS